MTDFNWEEFLRADGEGPAGGAAEQGAVEPRAGREEEELSDAVAEGLLGEEAPPPKQAAWILRRLCEQGRLERGRFMTAAVSFCLERGGAAAVGRLLAFASREEVGRVLEAEEPGALPGNPAMKRLRKAWAPRGGWVPNSWLGALSSRYAREGGSSELFAELLEAVGAGAWEGGLSAELAAAAVRGCPPGGGSLWRRLWALCCKALPGGGRGSLRWAAVEDLGRREDADEIFSWFAAQPDWSAQYGSALEYFGNPGKVDEYQLVYPRWVGRSGCSCCGCNTPTKTSEFLDPRAAGRGHLDDFEPKLREEFVRRIPRRALEWSLEAWKQESDWDWDWAWGAHTRRNRISRRRKQLLELAAGALAAGALAG